MADPIPLSRYPRFHGWGEKAPANLKPNGLANDEVARRFRMELVEDKKLNIPILQRATPEDIKTLCDYFHG